MSEQGDGQAGIDVHEAARLHKQNEAVVLDVRDTEEWEAGHIPDALFVPTEEVHDRLDELPIERRIVTVCRSGKRSGQVAAELRERGYRADNIEGGMEDWQAAGLPMEPPGGRVA